jgi:hypothetical protein
MENTEKECFREGKSWLIKAADSVSKKFLQKHENVAVEQLWILFKNFCPHFSLLFSYTTLALELGQLKMQKTTVKFLFT